MATAPYDPYELTPNSHKIMLAALMKNMGAPNPSPAGAAANALAMGLMGLFEGQDEKQKISGLDAQILGNPATQSSVPAVSSPMGNIPPPARSSALAAATGAYTPPEMPVEGGSTVPMPPPRPAMDRNQFVDEANDPQMAQRLATITQGEVGRGATPEQKSVLLESILNRAKSRDQSLADVTQMYTGPGSKGYYPQSTFTGGSASPDEVADFAKNILAPALRGGDVSTAALGFPATGNASGGVAERGIANGRYSQSAMLGPETFVQQPGGREDIARLDASRLNGQPPQPVQMADASGNVMIPQGARPAGPANQQIAQAPQVTPTASPVYMQMNDQTNRMIEQYRNATDAQKRVLGPQILQQQNEMRKMEQDLQKEIYLQNYKNTHPSYSESQGTFGERNTRSLARDKALGEADAAVPVAASKGLAKQAETEGETRGKLAGAFPIAEANLNMALKDAEALRKHPGRESSMGTFMGNVPDALIPANTDAYDFVNRLGQVKGQSFLKAYETLKGGGSITEVEGAKATSAMNRLSRALTQPEFDRALNDYQDAIRTGLDKLREVSGRPQQGTAAPSGQFDYGSVKSGETYTAPDGSRRIKR
jgi:hypothetical protein